MKTALTLATVGLFISLISYSASAQSILLTVNDSNPNAVTFTATGTSPLINSSDFAIDYGVDLLDFLTSSTSFNISAATGDLVPGGASISYNSYETDNYSGGGHYNDLNLYNGESAATQNFSTSEPAFTGVGTIDLSSLTADLPTSGSSGDILVGYSGLNSGEIIGTWDVEATATPEPGVNSLLALGLLATGIMIYRRRAKLSA